jgi:signal transduction histidine kinase
MAGFSILAVLLAFGMAFSIHRLASEADVEVGSIREEEEKITMVERLRWSAALIASRGRGYLLSGDPQTLGRVREARSQFNEIMTHLRAQTIAPEGLALEREVDAAAQRFILLQDELLAARKESGELGDLPHRLESELVPLRRALDDSLARLVEYKEGLLARHYQAVGVNRTHLVLRLHGLLAVLLITCIGISWYFANRLGAAIEHERFALVAARQAAAARDELMGIMAHDLRNPLNAIAMKAALLRKTADSERARKQAESMEQVASRMGHLITDMLDVSILEAGKFSVVPTEVSIADLLRSTLELFGPLAASKDVRLDSKVREAGLSVKAERERVLQVLSNLVGNAIEFTPAGGQVAIIVEREGTMMRFGVLDTGSGIAREKLPRVFDRFWTERPGNTGTGLGLFIAKGIVLAHGGKIWVDSDAGRGAKFYFTLPLVDAQETVALPPVPHPRSAHHPA